MAATHEEVVRRIKQAMASAGLTQHMLAERIQVDATAMSKSFSGKRNFKTLEIARIAEELHVPVSSLLSDVEAAPAVLLAARAQPSSNTEVSRAVARADTLVEIDALLTQLGCGGRTAETEIKASDGTTPRQQGKSMARQLRERLGIGSTDLPPKLDDFAGWVEDKLGIDVAFEPLAQGLDGLSVSSNSFRLAMVSSGISATRQRFTLAHEVGHLLAGDTQELRVDENIDSGSDDEKRANSFAAYLLMPPEALREVATRGILGEDAIAELLGRFRVSLESLAFQLKNTGLIDDAELNRIRRMSSSKIALRTGRAADLQARNDRRYPELLLDRTLNAYAEGLVSVRLVSRLVEIPVDLIIDDLSPPPRREDHHGQSSGDSVPGAR